VRRFNFHVVGLPHLSVSKTNSFCAYTQKVLNFCRMMRQLGHYVCLYGAPYREGDEVPADLADEFHLVVTPTEQHAEFGCYGHPAELVGRLQHDPRTPFWQKVNERTTAAIAASGKAGFVCVIGGSAHAPLATGALPVVEFGIGYSGTFADFRVFESYSHMHLVYGADKGYEPDGQYYDAVIPNYFDLADFGYCGLPHEGYLLYVGRMCYRKGIQTVDQLAQHLGMPVKYAGHGAEEMSDGLRTDDGCLLTAASREYVGVVDVARRRQLMQRAKAVIAPTVYVEPFGGVVVEAMLCGTPVITTDWGAFTETVDHGVNGFRCRTLDQFCRAVRSVDALSREVIYRNAAQRWGLQRVMWQYQEYFEMLDDLRGAGWEHTGAHRPLDWLQVRSNR